MGVWRSYNLHLDYKKHAMHCLLLLPDWSFIMRMALALANSSAVTHLCLSTSVLAFRWYVRPPLLRTMLQASSVSMCAVAKLIVPRHVWAISACVLQQNTRRKERLICHTTDGMVYLTFIRPTSTSREARRDRQRNAQLLYKHSLWKPSSTWNTYFTKHTCSLWAQSSSNEI